MKVEEGTGILDSNSYVTVEYADGYFSMRSEKTWLELENAEKETALVKASDYIDNAFKWCGQKENAKQALKFPRKNLFDEDGYEVKGVPRAIKDAVCECAFLISSGNKMYRKLSDKGDVVSEHIGSLAFSYDVSSKIKDSSVYEQITLRLRGLYEDGSKKRIVVGKITRF